MKRVIVGVLAVLAMVALVGCGEAATPQKVSGGSDGSKAQAATKTEKYKIGDTVKIGDVQVKLNKVLKLKNTEFEKPQDSNNMFVAVDLTVTNTSSEAQAVSSLLQLSVKDADGYAASQSFHSKAKPMPEGELAPGAKASGQVVYEVAKKAKGLELVYDASLLGTGQVVWTVGDAAKIK